MGVVTRNFTTLLPTQTKAFKKLAQVVVAGSESLDSAAEALGLSRYVLSRLLDEDYLTSKQAERFMVGYRKWKKTCST